METPSSSPDRPLAGAQVCKVTYLERKKRKRTLSNQIDSDTDASSISKPNNNPPMTTTASPSSESTTSKGPKKIEVSLPGPSPKRLRHDTNEPTTAKEPLKAKKVTHVRSASSISSMNPVAELSGDASSTNKKPLSTRKPRSKAKFVMAEDDDNVSVADSSVTIRRNEAERVEYFQNQSECGKMEPHHVQCLRCGKSVNLGRKQTYAVRPWEIHRARCDQKPAQTVEASPTTEKVVPEEAVPDTPSVTALPISESYVARRQTEEERKAYLESDKQAEIVEEGRVYCRKCQKWIILSDKQAFSTGKWVKHKSRCSDIVPSNRVAAAKRQLLVVNDPQAKSFDARRIECTFCGTNISLQGEGDFNLTKWDEHKTQCTKSAPITRSESANSIAFPRQFSRAPSASTEETLIVSESVPSGTSPNLKRNREEPEAAIEDTERPTVRPRTESYVPPEREAPSPFGWFLLPFQSFARGFRESLKNGS